MNTDDETPIARAEGKTAGAWGKWKRRGVWCALALVVLGGLLLLVSRTETGAFYLRFPSMSRSKFEEIERKAREGDAVSQLYYGVFYANGDGIGQNYAEAAKWYEKAAGRENARAMRNLALLYECGLGVERDHQRAFDLYWRAAELGDAAAHMGVAGYRFTHREKIMPPELGHYSHWRLKAFYLIGLKFTDHTLEAAFWKQYHARAAYSQKDELVVAAVKNKADDDMEAQLRMSQFYFQEQGIAKNDEFLWSWVQKAADSGSPRAKFILATGLGSFSKSIVGTEEKKVRYLREAADSLVEQLFTYKYAVKITGNKSKDYDMLRELAADGYIPAALEFDVLDRMLFIASSTLEEQKNIKIKEECINQFIPDTYTKKLIGYYLSKQSIAPDVYISNIRNGAIHGNSQCMLELAKLHAIGLIVPKNFKKSTLLFKTFMTSKDIFDLLEMSTFLSKLEHVPGYGFMKYHKARADNGIALSQLFIAVSFYYAAFNYNKDETRKSVDWCLKAAESGDAYAFFLLGEYIFYYNQLMSETEMDKADKLLYRYIDSDLTSSLAAKSYMISAKMGCLPAQIKVIEKDALSFESINNVQMFQSAMAREKWYTVNTRIFSASLFFYFMRINTEERPQVERMLLHFANDL